MRQASESTDAFTRVQLTIPGSQTLTSRAILLATLASGISELSNIRISTETRLLTEALTQLGIAIQLDESNGTCIIGGADGTLPKNQATLWCADSHNIASSLLAVCAITSGVFYFDGNAQLREISLALLTDTLKQLGAQFIPSDVNKMPLTLIGTDNLHGDDIIINRSGAGEMISGLLMVAPYTHGECRFLITHPTRQPSIELTCGIMATFGVKVNRIHQGQISIPAPQRYQARDYAIEPDFSIASYFFAAAAVTGGEITIQPVRYKTSKQPEAKFLDVLEKMGCHISSGHDGLTVKGPDQLMGVEVNLLDCPEIFPALAAIAPFAKSPVKVTGIHLTHTDCMQINQMKRLLNDMAISIDSGTDWIQIHPGTPKSGFIDYQSDPDIAMALSIIELREPTVTTREPDHAAQICPEFHRLWKKAFPKP